jgi:hypothetical protein
LNISGEAYVFIFLSQKANAKLAFLWQEPKVCSLILEVGSWPPFAEASEGKKQEV